MSCGAEAEGVESFISLNRAGASLIDLVWSTGSLNRLGASLLDLVWSTGADSFARSGSFRFLEGALIHELV